MRTVNPGDRRRGPGCLGPRLASIRHAEHISRRTWQLAIATAVAAVLAASSSALGTAPSPPCPTVQQPAPVPDDGRGTPYIVDKSDNICGIDEPRAITNPAKVDVDALLASTPEVRQIKKKKITLDSAEGIHLMTKARRKVLAACEAVCTAEGHCSIWKKIERRDQRPVEDITLKAKAVIKA